MTEKTTDDNAAALEALNQRLTALETENTTLKNHNKTLLDEKKKAKEAADAADAAREEAEAATALASSNVEDVKSALAKQHQKDLAKAQKERDDALAARDQLMNERNQSAIDVAIRDQLAASKVGDAFRPMLATALKHQAKVEDGTVVVNGKAVEEYFNEWRSSDEAKHYIEVAHTSGGGSVGSTNSSTSHGFTKDNINSRLGEFMVFSTKNPDQAKAIAASIGRPDLAP